MDFVDFDESLPSHSAFIEPVVRFSMTSMQTVHEQRPYGNSHTSNKHYDSDGNDSSTPPPPPPPASAASRSTDRESKQTYAGSSRGSGAKKGNGPFPFLRKNSRVEPAALNRLQEPTKATPSREKSGFDSYEPPITNKFSPMEEDEVMLDGSAYWDGGKAIRPASTANQQRWPENRSPEKENRGSPEKGYLDTTADYSTISIAKGWTEKRIAVQRELDEFELIERQLEGTAKYSHVAPLRPLPTPPNDPEYEDYEEAEDWGEEDHALDARVYESKDRGGGGHFDWSGPNTSNAPDDVLQDSFVMPSHQGLRHSNEYEDMRAGDVGRTLNSTGRTEKFDAGEGMEGMEGTEGTMMDDPPRSRTMRDDEDADSYEGGRKSYTVDGYLDMVRPPESHWTKEKEKEQDGRQSRDANRASRSESPSWGRVTRPPLPAEEREGMTARMSTSALRKISSRNAALQQQRQGDTYSSDAPSHASAYSDPSEQAEPMVLSRPLSSQQRSRLSSTSPNPMARSRGAIPGRNAGPSDGAGGSGGSGGSYIDASLTGKAKELEQELATYRGENANLKKLRRQQESALAELVLKREEVLQWAAEEKNKTLKWCEDQTQAAARERRSAGKMARDSRQKAMAGTAPIRKERAELDGLHATIEKMKVDHETAAKKWKLNESRLYSLIKEHTAHIEEKEKQVLALEQDKLLLLEFVGEQGLRLPKTLRGVLQRGALVDPRGVSGGGGGGGGGRGASAGAGSSRSSSARNVLQGRSADAGGYRGDRGYAEEVDVDVVEGPQSTAQTQYSLAQAHSQRPQPQRPQSQSPSFPGELFNTLSDPLRSGALATRSSLHDMGQGDPMRGHQAPSTTASWARSSRSSARYSGSEDREDDSGAAWTDALRESTVSSRSNQSNKENGYKDAGLTIQQERWRLGQSEERKATNAGEYGNGGAGAGARASTGAGMGASMGAGAGAGVGANRAEEVLPSGKRLIRYRNGTVKEVELDGTSVVRFMNGDTKTARSDSVVYYYAEAETTHTTYADGQEVYEFPNKQTEMHNPDGVKEIVFPDGTRKIIRPDGTQESHFPDGVVLREFADGRREVMSN